MEQQAAVQEVKQEPVKQADRETIAEKLQRLERLEFEAAQERREVKNRRTQRFKKLEENIEELKGEVGWLRQKLESADVPDWDDL